MVQAKITVKVLELDGILAYLLYFIFSKFNS